MMDEYYKEFDLIRGTDICRAAGVELADLNLGRVCLNYILSKCNINGCTRRGRTHPRANTATIAQVNELCATLKPGVDEMTRAKRRRVDEYGSRGWGN